MVSSRACPVLHGEPGPAKGNIVVILISTGTRKFIMYTVQRRAQDFFFFGVGRGDPASESDEDNEKIPG